MTELALRKLLEWALGSSSEQTNKVAEAVANSMEMDNSLVNIIRLENIFKEIGLDLYKN